MTRACRPAADRRISVRIPKHLRDSTGLLWTLWTIFGVCWSHASRPNLPWTKGTVQNSKRLERDSIDDLKKTDSEKVTGRLRLVLDEFDLRTTRSISFFFLLKDCVPNSKRSRVSGGLIRTPNARPKVVPQKSIRNLDSHQSPDAESRGADFGHAPRVGVGLAFFQTRGKASKLCAQERRRAADLENFVRRVVCLFRGRFESASNPFPKTHESLTRIRIRIRSFGIQRRETRFGIEQDARHPRSFPVYPMCARSRERERERVPTHSRARLQMALEDTVDILESTCPVRSPCKTHCSQNHLSEKDTRRRLGSRVLSTLTEPVSNTQERVTADARPTGASSDCAETVPATVSGRAHSSGTLVERARADARLLTALFKQQQPQQRNPNTDFSHKSRAAHAARTCLRHEDGRVQVQRAVLAERSPAPAVLCRSRRGRDIYIYIYIYISRERWRQYVSRGLCRTMDPSNGTKSTSPYAVSNTPSILRPQRASYTRLSLSLSLSLSRGTFPLQNPPPASRRTRARARAAAERDARARPVLSTPSVAV